MNNPLLIFFLHIKPGNNQKWIIHEKLRVATSEREGKLSNPPGRAARARCMEKIYGHLRKPARTRRARVMQLFRIWAGHRYSRRRGQNLPIFKTSSKISKSQNRKTYQLPTKFSRYLKIILFDLPRYATSMLYILEYTFEHMATSSNIRNMQ
jgi:hypothetical protein